MPFFSALICLYDHAKVINKDVGVERSNLKYLKENVDEYTVCLRT